MKRSWKYRGVNIINERGIETIVRPVRNQKSTSTAIFCVTVGKGRLKELLAMTHNRI